MGSGECSYTREKKKESATHSIGPELGQRIAAAHKDHDAGAFRPLASIQAAWWSHAYLQGRDRSGALDGWSCRGTWPPTRARCGSQLGQTCAAPEGRAHEERTGRSHTSRSVGSLSQRPHEHRWPRRPLHDRSRSDSGGGGAHTTSFVWIGREPSSCSSHPGDC